MSSCCRKTRNFTSLRKAMLASSRKRGIRRRKLRWLLARLKEISKMELQRDDLLMKLGAARAKAPAAWRLLDVEVAPEGATFSYTLNRKKLRKVWRREGRYLLRTNLSGRGPAELWQFYIQLVEVEAAFKGAAAAAGKRPHSASRPRQIRCYPNARCPLPHNGRAHADPQPLHGTQCRSKAPREAAQPRPARPTATTDHRRRPNSSGRRTRPVVETFGGAPLIFQAFLLEWGKQG